MQRFKTREGFLFFPIYILIVLVASYIFFENIKIIGMPAWFYIIFFISYVTSWGLFKFSSNKYRTELIDFYPFCATISGLAMPGFFAAGTKNDIPGPNQLLDHMLISASSISMFIVLVAMPVIVLIYSFFAAYKSRFPEDPPS
jgi:hypothetical protein